ncbi:Gfo/Idh/MocA family protein [Paenibacillus sp. y28]|uniref:Gfo/Idh/MocA family protein n=1 Tax=Paenibacillus sp. y28 TaxID=3129110 RepID=UPI00301998B3
MDTLRLGILGCADIVRRAVFQPLPQLSGIQAAGIANRTRSRAERLAAEFGIEQVFEGLEELLDSPDLDAVYIALSNELHAEWAIRAIQAGKHVLVEKPLALHAAQAKQIAEAAHSSGLHVWEALMVRHHPWQAELRRLLETGRYGQALRLHTELNIPAKADSFNNYRSFPDKGGGVFYDLGCYWLQFIQAMFGLEDARVADWGGRSDFAGPRGCDWSFVSFIRFTDGPFAAFSGSFEKPYRARHVVETEGAVLTINDFFRANVGRYKITIKVENRSGQLLDMIEFEPQHYYENQLGHFRDAVLYGHPPDKSLYEALERVRWMELIRQSAVLQHKS